MKYSLTILVLAFILTSCGRSVRGNGHLITQKREVGSFDGVKSSAGINVEITVDDSQGLEVEADDNIMALVSTKVVNNILLVCYIDNTNVRNAQVTVRISARELSSLRASSSSDIVVNGILKSDKTIKIHANSSGSVTLEVDAPAVETEASSSGEIDIRGRTQFHKSEASSSGDVLASELLAERADANASSSGEINLHCSIDLSAKASSSGDINYRGNPTSPKIKTSSAGSVERDQ